MRGPDLKQNDLFSYTTLEQRIPKDLPLRPLRELVDTILVSMDSDFEVLYSSLGRAAIPPERLLRASLLQAIYTVRSECGNWSSNSTLICLFAGSSACRWTNGFGCGFTRPSVRTETAYSTRTLHVCSSRGRIEKTDIFVR